MTRNSIIRAIHAAASKGDMAECMRLFRRGEVTEKVFKQVIREAQSNNPSTRRGK
jgi:hypothetical protein